MTRSPTLRSLCVALALATLPPLLPACAPSSGAAASTQMANNSSSWRPLTGDEFAAVWRGYRSDSLPGAWHMAGDTLTKSVGTDDLITREPYGDFELELDWKLSSGGNAGIFYRATEEYDHIYWSGPEYQLLDDAGHPDGRSRLTAAGSAYGLYPSEAGIVKGAGEWNSTRIVVRGAQVEHWLNGEKLLEYELWSPAWQERVAKSKFSEWRDYGRARSGYIGIQGDHDGELSLRNIRIRALD
jgi:hypothetical protein